MDSPCEQDEESANEYSVDEDLNPRSSKDVAKLKCGNKNAGKKSAFIFQRLGGQKSAPGYSKCDTGLRLVMKNGGVQIVLQRLVDREVKGSVYVYDNATAHLAKVRRSSRNESTLHKVERFGSEASMQLVDSQSVYQQEIWPKDQFEQDERTFSQGRWHP
eukprot:Gb_41345 [translate_table: standard]